MNLKKQNGSFTTSILLFIAIGFFMLVALEYRQAKIDALQDLKQTPVAYSAEYAQAVKTGVNKPNPLIVPGLYQKLTKEGDLYETSTILFSDDHTFQYDRTIVLLEKPPKPILKAVVRGEYKQVGAVIEFTNLTGDLGLIPQQKRILLEMADAKNIEIRGVSGKGNDLYQRVGIESAAAAESVSPSNSAIR